MRALLSRLLKDLSTQYAAETAHYNETDTRLNSRPGKTSAFSFRTVNYKRSTARQGRSPLYLTWDAVILTRAALLGPISSLSPNADLKTRHFSRLLAVELIRPRSRTNVSACSVCLSTNSESLLPVLPFIVKKTTLFFLHAPPSGPNKK